MPKPTREEFRAAVLERYPSAAVEKEARGLAITVMTVKAAQNVQHLARTAGLTSPEDPRVVAGLGWRVRIFGFPRRSAVVKGVEAVEERDRLNRGAAQAGTYFPADAYDEDLKTILTKIEALANNPHWTADRRWRIAELAMRGLRLLEGKDG